MRALNLLLLALTLSAASRCKAQTACPWINKATVAGLFEAKDAPPSRATVVESTPCVFTYHSENAERTLRVIVAAEKDSPTEMTPFEAVCKSPETALQAIGNEASLCDFDRPGEIGEQVMGRVRDQHFLISLSTNTIKGSAAQRAQLRDAATMVAELVAGNMF